MAPQSPLVLMWVPSVRSLVRFMVCMVLNDGSLIQPMLILIPAPGGFFVFGMLIALFNRLARRYKRKEPATLLSCCNCPQAASCMKASEGGCE